MWHVGVKGDKAGGAACQMLSEEQSECRSLELGGWSWEVLACSSLCLCQQSVSSVASTSAVLVTNERNKN